MLSRVCNSQTLGGCFLSTTMSHIKRFERWYDAGVLTERQGKHCLLPECFECLHLIVVYAQSENLPGNCLKSYLNCWPCSSQATNQIQIYIAILRKVFSFLQLSTIIDLKPIVNNKWVSLRILYLCALSSRVCNESRVCNNRMRLYGVECVFRI